MKKLYNTPNVEMVLMIAQDVITTSIITERYEEKIDQYRADKAAWN